MLKTTVRWLALGLIMALVAVACGSAREPLPGVVAGTPEPTEQATAAPEAEADPTIKFSGYKTYAWLGSASIVYDPAGKWEPPQFDADTEIKFLIDSELRKRGMSEDTTNPEMIVVFAAGIDMAAMREEVDPNSNIAALQNVPQGALTVVLIDSLTGVPVNTMIGIGGPPSSSTLFNVRSSTIRKSGRSTSKWSEPSNSSGVTIW